MAGVRRNDAPADGDAFCLARRDGGDSRGGACFHRMFAPPRVGFGEPEGVKPCSVARLRHPNGFLEWFPAELQHTAFKAHLLRFDFSPFVLRSRPPPPLSRRL